MKPSLEMYDTGNCSVSESAVCGWTTVVLANERYGWLFFPVKAPIFTSSYTCRVTLIL